MKAVFSGLAAIALIAPAGICAAPGKPSTVAPKTRPAAPAPAIQPATQLPVFEFMGQRTDAPRTMTELQGEKCTTKGHLTECMNVGNPTVAGRTMLYVDIQFYDDKLFTVLGAFRDTDYPTLAEAFALKYGQPTKTEVRKWQSKAGATFDNRVMIWSFNGGGTLELESMGYKVGEGSFSFHSTTNAPPADAPKVDF